MTRVKRYSLTQPIDIYREGGGGGELISFMLRYLSGQIYNI